MKSSWSRVKSLILIATLLTLATTSAAAALSAEFVQTYPLTAGGAVSLENVNGDVSIEAWDRDEVYLEAVKKSRSQERLDEVEIDVDARPDRIRIKTRYPDRSHDGWFSRNDPASVNYTLRVPRGARLVGIELVNGSLRLAGVAGEVEASLVNGDVEATDLAGEVELETVNGRLEATFTQLEGDHDVDLSSVNGSVELRLPGGADAEIHAQTVHGSIRNDLGLEVERDGWVGRSLKATLGAGTARVELETVNGSISIRSGS